MKTILSIIKKIFKPVAVLKYLFFPYMVSHGAELNFAKILNINEPITATAYTEKSCWVGTNHGLYCINNKTGKVIHLTASNSVLPSDSIKAICVTMKENVFAATDKGVFRFDGYTYLAITNENANLPSSGITSIINDENDNLWIGTQNCGLILMRGYRTQYFNAQNSILDCNNVNKVSKNANGEIFAVLENGSVVWVADNNLHLMYNQCTEFENLALLN